MTALATRKEEKVRAFSLSLLPEGQEAFGILLTETTNERGWGRDLKLHLNAARARRVMESVRWAMKASGHPKWAVAAKRSASLPLVEEAGVRLALVMLTTAPLLKSRRVDAMTQAIAGMGTEEAYYWYAQCVGPDGHRARRAFRLLLADE